MPNADDAASIAKSRYSENTENQSMFKKFLNKFFFGKAGAWTAIFTFIVSVFSGLLWRVSDKANETSIVTQRAFLNFSGPALAKEAAGKKLKGINVYISCRTAVPRQQVPVFRSGTWPL